MATEVASRLHVDEHEGRAPALPEGTLDSLHTSLLQVSLKPPFNQCVF